ncbi:hypothetical protein Golob_007611, partial [Gossypium lobatum]|nr:hypothetical protein [Gossypium lobatum]
MIVVASDALRKKGAVYGKKFTMKYVEPRNGIPHPCTGKSVTIKVIDQCPGCPSIMDLSRESFKIIAKPIAGIISIDYKKGNDCLKWKKPDHQTIKINCDASWTSESRWAAIAAVVRDCTGK